MSPGDRRALLPFAALYGALSGSAVDSLVTDSGVARTIDVPSDLCRQLVAFVD